MKLGKYIGIGLAYAVSLSCLLGLYACEADTLTRDPSACLQFPSDTLSFDTVFTEIGSATKQFRIYNRNKNRLHIDAIRLGSGAYFQVNVDGLSAQDFRDMDICGNDSMTLFAQVNINPNEQTLPFLVKDSLMFSVNGHEQKLMLCAYGQNAVRIHRYHIRQDSTLTDYLPILIYDTLWIDAGATVQCQPGTRLYFRKNAVLIVDGSLQAEGTYSSPVEFRGDRDDYMNTRPPLSYDQASAQWGGIRIRKGSANNVLVHADVRNATFGLCVDSTDVVGSVLYVRNSMLRNSSGNVLSIHNAEVELYNSVIYNAGGYLIEMHGGSCSIKHCTIANYYSFAWGGRTQPCMLLSNRMEGGTELPFSFTAINTIVYGGYNNEIVYDMVSEFSGYHFTNCLVRMLASNIDDHYTDCVVSLDPKFRFTQRSEEEKKAQPYAYDFHLTSASPAISKALWNIALEFPLDYDGNDRLSDGVADIGAYEFVP